MATTPKGSASGTNTATLPAHAAGDKIVIWAYRDGSNTAPTVPAGYVTLGTITGNTNSGVLAMKVAAGSSETVGTFTNATSLIAAVFDADAMIGAIGTGNTGASTSVTYGALACQVATGSTVYGVSGHRSTNTTLETPPTGMTNVITVNDATDEAALHRTTSTVSSWSSTAVSVGGTSSGWVSMNFEVRTLDNMANWETALAATIAGTADSTILFKGDSLTAGADASTQIGARATAFPTWLAANFTSAAASDASFLGSNNMDFASGGINGYDPRITLGSAWSWATGFVPLGAKYLLSGGAGTNTTFNPGSVAFDTVDFYYGGYSGGPSISVTRDGGTAVGSVNTNAGSDGALKSSLTVPSGAHTMELVGTTANAYILGMIARSSTTRRVHFVNGAWFGQTAVAFASNAAYGAFQVETLIDPALKVYMLGTNDKEAGATAAAYTAAMLAEAILTQKNGGSILFIRPPYATTTTHGTEASQNTFYNNVELIAAAVGAGFIDLRDNPNFATLAAQQAAGYMASDNLHLSPAGYQAIGAMLLPAIEAESAGSTYNEAVGLGATMAASFSPSGLIAAALPVAVIVNAQDAATAAGTSTLAFSVANQLAAAGRGTFAHGLLLGIAASASIAATIASNLALSIASQARLASDARHSVAAAVSLAVDAAVTNGRSLTAQGALSMAANAGFSSTTTITAQSAAAFAFALSLVAGDGVGSQTFDEEIAVGIAALIAQAGGAAIVEDIAIASEVAATIGAAVGIASSMQLSTKVAAATTGGLLVQGAIAFGARPSVFSASQAAVSADLLFTAEFDAEAASRLSAKDAVNIAVRAVLAAGVPTENEIVDVIHLAGSRHVAVSLGGSRQTGVAITGTMTITVRLSGRLN